MLELLIYLGAGLLTVSVPVIYFLRERTKSRHAHHTLAKAVERGLDEPVSLHPYIDPAICIGTAACVKACPETDVLGLIDNRGVLINPGHCIGHGLCQAACPVDAITLVFGTEKRGVDIPYVSGAFETNVPGIYIAGELGGMGLIRNAVSQGRQAVQSVARSLGDKPARDSVLDLIIVGAGPAGISASLQARKDKLNFVVVDQDDLGGTVLSYPRRKLVMTQPMDLPLYGAVKFREIEKEALMNIFSEVFVKTGLSVNGEEKAEDIQREGECFRVVTSKGNYEAKKVLLAIGRRGSPRKLGVPGEKSAKVSYRLLDPEHFSRMRLLVVGGGDSAVEAALALAEQPGNTVHVSYRREGFFRLKEGNRSRADAAIRRGTLIPVFQSEVIRIDPQTVFLQQEGQSVELPNDYVFVFAGGELPTEFLRKAGVEVTRKFGQK